MEAEAVIWLPFKAQRFDAHSKICRQIEGQPNHGLGLHLGFELRREEEHHTRIGYGKTFCNRGLHFDSIHNLIRLGDEIRDLWMRYRYGVFSDMRDDPVVSDVHNR